MDRKRFLQTIGLAAMAGTTMKLSSLGRLANDMANTDTMPVLFVGHGSPMNAIEDNVFSREMKALKDKIAVPTAILMVSAHWETKGTFVTAQTAPPTIHDFGGFPKALFDVEYPAPGSPWLAAETKAAVSAAVIGDNHDWGFDHGCWSVTRNIYPEANIPIIQLSLDYTLSPEAHYNLATQLASLRKKGVLIIGSGNMVHNLGMMSLKGNDFNESFGYDWAIEANETFKKLINERNHTSLQKYRDLGQAVKLAVPTPDHYLPLLYTLALQQEKEEISYFNDVPVAGSISMTSLRIG